MNDIIRIPVAQIDAGDRWTDFSLDPSAPEDLVESVRELGITHPLLLSAEAGVHRVIRGHRRLRAALKLGIPEVPALLSPVRSAVDKLASNLLENLPTRRYSDIEKGVVLSRFVRAGAPQDTIVSHYMPWLGLERSKKLCTDLIRVEELSESWKQLLHAAGIPLRNFSLLFGWDAASRDAAEKLFSALQPGAGKWRELAEFLDESARRDGLTPGDIILRPEFQTILEQDNLQAHEKYNRVLASARELRFPALSEMRRNVRRCLDRLRLDPNILLRNPDNFENDDIRFELRFASQEQLIALARRLAEISPSEDMAELIRRLQAK